MFYKEAKSELLLLFFFFFLGGGGGREAVGWRKGIFFSQRIQIKKMHSLDLELAIDHPPQGEFCTLLFSETTLYIKQNDTCKPSVRWGH